MSPLVVGHRAAPRRPPRSELGLSRPLVRLPLVALLLVPPLLVVVPLVEVLPVAVPVLGNQLAWKEPKRQRSPLLC